MGQSFVPFYISSISIAALTLSIVIAWFSYGRDALPPRSLCRSFPTFTQNCITTSAFLAVAAPRRG